MLHYWDVLWVAIARPLLSPSPLNRASTAALRASVAEPAPLHPLLEAVCLEELPSVPRHIAVIMDGNSRWAAARGRPTAEGHAAGVEALRRLIGDCAALGAVRELSVYAFSHENWLRPRSEVQALLSLIESVLLAEADALLATGVQLSFVGDLTRLSPALQRLLARVAARHPPAEAWEMQPGCSRDAAGMQPRLRAEAGGCISTVSAGSRLDLGWRSPRLNLG